MRSPSWASIPVRSSRYTTEMVCVRSVMKISHDAQKTLIVRVAPNELHIKDSRFFEQIYGQNPRLDKPGWANKFGMKDVTFITPQHGLHRERRGALSPM